MSVQGLPVEGLHTVGQIVATNALTFHAGENTLEIAVALLSTHTAGAPVVDETGSGVQTMGTVTFNAGPLPITINL